MRRTALALATIFACAAPAAAKAPPVGESLLAAVQKGDTTLMSGLRGARTRFAGAVVRVYRDTKSYRDYLVASDAGLGAAAAGPLRYLVRVAGDRRGSPAPAEITGLGEVTDFEMEAVAGGLRWYPVLELDTAP